MCTVRKYWRWFNYRFSVIWVHGHVRALALAVAAYLHSRIQSSRASPLSLNAILATCSTDSELCFTPRLFLSLRVAIQMSLPLDSSSRVPLSCSKIPIWLSVFLLNHISFFFSALSIKKDTILNISNWVSPSLVPQGPPVHLDLAYGPRWLRVPRASMCFLHLFASTAQCPRRYICLLPPYLLFQITHFCFCTVSSACIIRRPGRSFTDEPVSSLPRR
ncbi:hypothetical protein K438DRAFT_940034 [Mycena galopus ATCC 62051]|nr:hypothetical protein K438DRAFT_940034 [Mycena galopus ATCC 62051]